MASAAVRTVQYVSVVVVTRNNREGLVECLDSVENQDFATMETIVVDNASTDGTTSEIQADYPWVNYIDLEEDRGVGAYNVGLEAATGELIIVLSANSRLPGEGIVSRIVRKFRENKNLGAAGFRTIDPGGEEIDWFRWAEVGDFQSGYLSPAFLIGAAAIRPEIYERTEGFWEPYYFHVADQDLATRIISTGAEIRYFPSITFVLDRSAKRRRGTRYKYLITRNMLWYYWRNYGLARAAYKTGSYLLRLTGEVLAGKSDFRPVAKGITEGFWGIKRALKTREPVKSRYLPLVEGKELSWN